MHFLGFRAIIVGVLYVIKIFMKKIFMQLWQRILKYKKKLIYGALALFVGQICFFWLWWIGVQNEVFADEPTASTDTMQQKVTEMETLMRTLNKIIYVLVYPMLLIAWKLVDNSLVYGEVFWFDAVLWNLWIIIRNIANFTLWFIFIFYIFKYLIKQDAKQDWKWLIIRALIAWVLIQSSWFIMAALIDISTIATYWVGWLPITVLWTGSGGNEQLKENPYILNTVVSIDTDDLDTYNVYLSNKDKTEFISSCRKFYIDTWDNAGSTFIIAPEMVYYMSGDSDCLATELWMCHDWDQVYIGKAGLFAVQQQNYTNCTDWKDWQNGWNTMVSTGISSYKSNSGDISDKINEGALLLVWETKGTGSNVFWLDEWNKIIWSRWNSYRLEDILSGSYVGVFGALYGSLLNAWSDLMLVPPQEWDSIYVKLLNTALSLGHMIAVNIPLIVMLVVFMIRIWVLRLGITLSPIIVLLKVFDLEKTIQDKVKVKILEYLQVPKLIWIIFSPVIICFAISMSTILVRLIADFNWVTTNLWTPEILGWLIRLTISWMAVNAWKLIISILWIAVTWFLMRAAVKSSAIWESGLVKSLETFAKTSLWSLPIVPVPTKSWVKMLWVDSVFGGNGREGIVSQYVNDIKRQYNDENSKALEQVLNPKEAKEEAAKKVKETQVNDYIYKLTHTEDILNWQTSIKSITKDENGKYIETTYEMLSDENKKKVVQAINEIWDVDKRKKFFEAPFKIGDDEYSFVETHNNKSVNKWLTKDEVAKLKN